MHTDADILALTKEVGKLIGWEPTGNADEDSGHSHLTKNGMKFQITRDYKGSRDRVIITTWRWPSYVTFDHGERRETITPRDLYDPKETSPEISVAISRGAAAIAKEIQKRFLPEYERLWNLCTVKAMARGTANRAARDGWEKVCAALGKSPKHTGHYVDTPVGKSLHVENRQGTIHVTFDWPVDDVLKVLAAMGVK